MEDLDTTVIVTIRQRVRRCAGIIRGPDGAKIELVDRADLRDLWARRPA
jgi:hypothetical protein